MEIGKKIEWNGKGSKSKPIIRDPLRFSSHSFSTYKCKFSFSINESSNTLFRKAVASTRKLHFTTGANLARLLTAVMPFEIP